MDVQCRIELLGVLRVVQGDTVHTRFRTHKAAALLAYLALHLDRSHGREQLITLFWPDMETEAGRDNLSAALSQLRRQLEPPGSSKGAVLIADWRQVRLNTDAVTTDVAAFDRALTQARQPGETKRKIALLTQATELYQGDLLPGFYDDWAISEQNRCQAAYRESLSRLTSLLEQEERYADALLVAQKIVASDPLNENGYEAQMRLQTRLGQPLAALQAFEQAKAVWRKELNAPPPALLQERAASLRKIAPVDPPPGREKGTDSVTKRAKTPPLAASQATPPPPPAPVAALPLTLTRFFGRAREQAQIRDLWQTPNVRLVTLLGPGGAGKTRLSIEVARQAAPVFGGRVWWVSLADLRDGRLAADALASALRLPPNAATAPLDQIIAFIGDAPALLVLDNLEQLLVEPGGDGEGGAASTSAVTELVQDLLARAPGLRCLVTSRQALQIGGEQILFLPPLAPPPAPEAIGPNAAPPCLHELMDCESVALYVDRARAVRPDFALTASNAQSVAAICRTLEGMPLALEMAATWVKILPPQKMQERLSHQLDLLVSRRRDLPPRHQSLRAVIEWSYDLLPPDVRETWARLSVFRGGWNLDAAEAVCGADALHALIVLQEHSVLAVQDDENNEPRYRMLEALREFAGEKLAQAEGEAGENARRDHADFFARLTHRDKTRDESGWYQAMEADHDNLRAAFDWLLHDAGRAEACLEFASRMQNFWLVRGYFREGRESLAAALARPGAEIPTDTRARALNRIAALACRQGDYEVAVACYEESFVIHSSMKNERGAAYALVGLGSVALMRRALSEAWNYHCKAMTLYRAQDDPMGLSDVLNNLGAISYQRRELSEARGFYEEGLALRRKFGDEQSIANALSNLGMLLSETGEVEKAASCLTECLQLCRALGNRRDGLYGLRNAAYLESQTGEGERAARLYGAIETLHEALGSSRSPSGEQAHQVQMGLLRDQIGGPLFDIAWRAGRALSWEQAVRFALREAEPASEAL